MKSIELLNRLTTEQKELLEVATAGKAIEKNDVATIKASLKKLSQNGKYADWNSSFVFSENPCERGWWSLSDEIQENFNEVFRYLNSLEDNEEIRKEKVIEIADRKHEKNQKELYERMRLGAERIAYIMDDLIETEHDLTMKLAIDFGFTYEEICQIVKQEYDFSLHPQNIIKDEFSKRLEEQFG